MKPLILAVVVLATASAGAAEPRPPTDIVVTDRTLVQRAVLRGAPSKRMIAVGQPGGFNFAFDAIHCAPVFTWSGGFLDYAGETNGRGGNGCRPLGVQQTLGIATTPLRIGHADTPPAAIRFLGYRRAAATGAPTFRFEVDGVAVEQRIFSASPGVVVMEFAFPGWQDVRKYYRIDPTPHRQIVLGEGLRWSGPGVIELPAGQPTARVELHLRLTGEAFVRDTPALSGAEIFRNYCSACHSTDGTKLVGPTFQGLWGREALVTRDGRAWTQTVDEAYVRESILKPQAAVVQGYETVPMADFSSVLTGDELERLIEYLRGMR